MPRPRKCRKVCCLPKVNEFLPTLESEEIPNQVVMTVDEYETIRLIDHEGFSQEECSASMKIARTTVQLIYNNARKKIAQVLVDGASLRIEGGDYQLCDGNGLCCGGCGCCRCMEHTPDPEKEEQL